jgi:hypothetical protein
MVLKMSVASSDQTKQVVIDAIFKAIEDVRFGSIEITVHDGRVTQIERREKVRFEHQNVKNSPTANNSGK